MVAIVYSGSKTAFWKLTQNGKVVAHCNTTGLNPCFVDRKTILQMLNKKIALVNHAEEIRKIFFFAAGASSKDRKEELADTLSLFFKYSKITVEDDLFGAAKAVCFDKSGIVGMIGNGANCAYFDGKRPIKNNFGLGYILGDEGSAAYLGKMLLKNFLSKKLPKDLEAKFNSVYGLDRAQIFERIYNKPQANNFLSSFFEFILQHKDHGYVMGLVDDGFDKHLKKYTLPMVEKYKDEELHFVGIVAFEFQERLIIAANKYDLTIKTIIKEPIHNLLKHFTN